jgi:hypothetical protein
MVPGNINTTDPIPTRFNLEQRSTKIDTNARSLIHAAGFGGPIALVILNP